MVVGTDEGNLGGDVGRQLECVRKKESKRLELLAGRTIEADGPGRRRSGARVGGHPAEARGAARLPPGARAAQAIFPDLPRYSPGQGVLWPPVMGRANEVKSRGLEDVGPMAQGGTRGARRRRDGRDFRRQGSGPCASKVAVGKRRSAPATPARRAPAQGGDVRQHETPSV